MNMVLLLLHVYSEMVLKTCMIASILTKLIWWKFFIFYSVIVVLWLWWMKGCCGSCFLACMCAWEECLRSCSNIMMLQMTDCKVAYVLDDTWRKAIRCGLFLRFYLSLLQFKGEIEREQVGVCVLDERFWY